MCVLFYAVKWKPVEMFDLLTTMQPVRADWKELAYNLIKKDQTTLKGHFINYVTIYNKRNV